MQERNHSELTFHTGGSHYFRYKCVLLINTHHAQPIPWKQCRPLNSHDPIMRLMISPLLSQSQGDVLTSHNLLINYSSKFCAHAQVI